MIKKKLFSCVALFIIGIYPGLCASYNAITNLRSRKFGFEFDFLVLLSGTINDKDNLVLFICYIGLLVTAIVWLAFSSSTLKYKSGLREIIPGIKTPLPSGENQHGSARWLRKDEYGRVFQKIKLYPRMIKQTIKWLSSMGEMDLQDDYYISEDEVNNVPLFEKGGIVVGYSKNGREIHIVDEDTHSYTIGATRCGKSRTLVIPSVCVTALAGESMVCSDPKGELFYYTYPFLTRLGYEVITIDFDNPAKSCRYNFMQPIIDYLEQRDLPRAKEATWELVEALVGETKGEPIWRNGECSIIAACVMAVAYDNMNSPQYQNLTNVFHFISRMCMPGDNGKSALQTYLYELPEDHPAKSMAAISDVAHWRTKSSFYASALATLRLFEDYNIADMTSRTDFDIYSTGDVKRAIFIILPDERLAYYSIASLFVSQHYQVLSGIAKKRGGRLANRVEFFLDEIGNFSYIPNFEKILTVGGGRGIRFHLFLQAIPQLDKIYGREVSAIIRANCETCIYLQSDDQQTLEEFSKKLGEYTTKSPSLSSSIGGGGSTSYNYMSRNLLTPEEIKRIRRPYQLVYSRSSPALLYAPDLSEMIFNSILGLGDKAHNTALMLRRNERREERRISAPQLWGIWHNYLVPASPMDSSQGSFTNLKF